MKTCFFVINAAPHPTLSSITKVFFFISVSSVFRIYFGQFVSVTFSKDVCVFLNIAHEVFLLEVKVRREN